MLEPISVMHTASGFLPGRSNPGTSRCGNLLERVSKNCPEGKELAPQRLKRLLKTSLQGKETADSSGLKSVCENSIFTQPLVRPQIGKHNALRKFLVLTHPLKPLGMTKKGRTTVHLKVRPFCQVLQSHRRELLSSRFDSPRTTARLRVESRHGLPRIQQRLQLAQDQVSTA